MRFTHFKYRTREAPVSNWESVLAELRYRNLYWVKKKKKKIESDWCLVAPSWMRQLHQPVHLDWDSSFWCSWVQPSTTNVLKSPAGETDWNLRSQNTQGERIKFLKSNTATSCLDSSVLWHHSPSLMSFKSNGEHFGFISCCHGQVGFFEDNSCALNTTNK